MTTAAPVDFDAWQAELPSDLVERAKCAILRDVVRRRSELCEQFGPDESSMPPEVQAELAEMRRLVDRL